MGKPARLVDQYPKSDIMSSMSLTITLRSFKRDPRYQRLAHKGDPADRLIAATAKAHGLTIITPDPEIAFHEVVPVVRYRWRKSRQSDR